MLHKYSRCVYECLQRQQLAPDWLSPLQYCSLIRCMPRAARGRKGVYLRLVVLSCVSLCVWPPCGIYWKYICAGDGQRGDALLRSHWPIRSAVECQLGAGMGGTLTAPPTQYTYARSGAMQDGLALRIVYRHRVCNFCVNIRACGMLLNRYRKRAYRGCRLRCSWLSSACAVFRHWGLPAENHSCSSSVKPQCNKRLDEW